MVTVSVPRKWERFLKRLADDHDIELNTLLSELCDWAFSDAEGKEQFKAWLDESHPPKGEAETEAEAAGEEAAEEEEEYEEEAEEESHEHRQY
jgi:hypothetical protein